MKILCVVDSYNWALANRARSLDKYMPSHQFTIKYFKELQKVNFNNYDIVYVLNWPIHGYIGDKIKPNRKYRLVTTVSSHIGRPNADRMKSLFKIYDSISVSNRFLFNEFSPVYGRKVFYTPFGVEEKLFKPVSKPSNFKYIFGWVGNNTRPVKRFDEIKKIFESLGNQYELKVIKGGYSRQQMADFYNKVGTVICYSSSEGTPNPILEGASCGRSIISTKVGNVPELIGNNKSIRIVKNPDQLRAAITRNAQSGSIIDTEGKFLRNQIVKNWTWEKRTRSFLPFLGIKHG